MNRLDPASDRLAPASSPTCGRLGATRWRALHRTGQIFVFGVYLVTYGGRVAEDASFWPGLALVLGAGALRLAAALYALRLRSSTLPTE